MTRFNDFSLYLHVQTGSIYLRSKGYQELSPRVKRQELAFHNFLPFRDMLQSPTFRNSVLRVGEIIFLTPIYNIHGNIQPINKISKLVVKGKEQTNETYQSFVNHGW